MTPLEGFAAWLIFMCFVLLWLYIGAKAEASDATEEADDLALVVSTLTQERDAARDFAQQAIDIVCQQHLDLMALRQERALLTRGIVH